MDLLLSKKIPNVRKRASFSLKFVAQKPTFTMPHGEPTRYYDFLDTPVVFKPASPLIDRQHIEPELESKIRYSCSLLVYRIERGVPSLPIDQSGLSSAREGQVESPPLNALLDSIYVSPNVGPEAVMLKSKFDSGVGLTQQPSMQTMRVLNSRSGKSLESEGGTTNAVDSGSRTSTSCSNSTATKSSATAESSFISSSVQCPNHRETQSMLNGNAMKNTRPQDPDTIAFLRSSSGSLTSDDTASEDVEVFLDPEAASIDSDGVPTFSPQTLLSNASPSLGISRETMPGRSSSNEQQKPGASSLLIGLGTSGFNENSQKSNPSVIIDSNGCAHILTEAEEAQRRVNLQKAVLAKMTTGIAATSKSSVSPSSLSSASSSSSSLPKQKNSTVLFNVEGEKTNLQSNTSRIKSFWTISGGITTTVKQRSQLRDIHPQSKTEIHNAPSAFKKIANFFSFATERKKHSVERVA